MGAFFPRSWVHITKVIATSATKNMLLVVETIDAAATHPMPSIAKVWYRFVEDRGIQCLLLKIHRGNMQETNIVEANNEKE